MSALLENSFSKIEVTKNNFVEKIIEPYAHFAKAPGKKIIARFSDASNIWMKIPEDKLQKVKEFIDLFYNIGLLVDDIEDGSVLRKGIPTAHQIYGIPFTINSVIYMTSVALEKVVEFGSLEAFRVVAKNTCDAYEGQGLDVYYRENLICPTMEQYRQLCILKVGGIYMMIIQLMQLFSDTKQDFTKLVELLSLFLQIRGDYLNLSSEEYSNIKSFCDDISEGKFSFPIIHAIRSHPENNKILNILKQRPADVERKKYCLTLLKEFGSLEFTKEILEKVKEELLEEINKIGDNPIMLDIVNNLLDFD